MPLASKEGYRDEGGGGGQREGGFKLEKPIIKAQHQLVVSVLYRKADSWTLPIPATPQFKQLWAAAVILVCYHSYH